jgi:hypothetical protein
VSVIAGGEVTLQHILALTPAGMGVIADCYSAIDFIYYFNVRSHRIRWCRLILKHHP